MTEEEKAERQTGRPKGEDTERYQLMLAPDDAEWGKKQPGGLSLLVRRLLREARENAERHQQG